MKDNKKTYLIALPCFKGARGFNHQTILVSAKDIPDCISLVRSIRPNHNIGDIKEVSYEPNRKESSYI